MEVLTAIENLRIEANNNKIDELKKIVDFIKNAKSIQEDWEGELKLILERIDIDETEMEIIVDVDEFFFNVDGVSFEEFSKKNFVGDFNSDKQFRIKGLKPL